MSIASKLITIAENLQAKLDAINVKLTAKGQTEAANLNEVPDKIEAIETGADVSNVTATASDVLSPKVFVDASGTEQTGTIATKTSSDFTTSGATVYVPAGYYANDTSKSIATATQATPSISINSSTGVITASATQSAGYVSSGTTSDKYPLPTQGGKSITPSTTAQNAVLKGRYTTGTVSVAGDSNLVASNIKSGVSIFGVSGSYSGGELSVGQSSVANPTSVNLITFSVTTTNMVGFLIQNVGTLAISSTYRVGSIFYLNSGNSTSRYAYVTGFDSSYLENYNIAFPNETECYIDTVTNSSLKFYGKGYFKIGEEYLILPIYMTGGSLLDDY